MGWTYLHKERGQSLKDFFQGEFGKGCEILELRSPKPTVAYMACKSAKTGEVFAAVCLMHRCPKSEYNFGYKDMDESMGPCESYCPESILKKLTPTTHEYATQWRERCWKNIESRKSKPKVKVGDIVVFNTPIHFTDGFEACEFKVVDLKRRIFTPPNFYGNYRISGWRNMEYQVKA